REAARKMGTGSKINLTPFRRRTTMKTLRSILAFLGFAATVAGAQMPPEASAPPRPDIATMLSIDSERAQKVEAILQSAHVKMRAARESLGRPTDETTRATLHAAMEAIRKDTDQQLLTVLTAEELQRLREALPPPREHGKKAWS